MLSTSAVGFSGCAIVISLLAATVLTAQSDIFDRVTHGYATSAGGVKIHYASLGKGPLVVMIHGFPDFWYSWRHQMDGLVEEPSGGCDRSAWLQPQ